MKHLQVENNVDLVREISSKAIINTNKLAYEKAQDAKNKRLKQQEDINTLKNRINTIENKLDKILTLLENK